MVIGNLRVILGLDTAQFASGMAGAKTQVGGFGAVLSGTSAALAGFGLVANGISAGMAAVRSVVNTVSGAFRELVSTLKEMEDTTEAAGKLGMGVDSLVGLRYAARFADVAVEELGMALMQMEKRLSEAVGKTGAVRDALTELKLNPKELVGLAPDEAFLKIVGALSQIESQTSRVRLAFELFGKAGQKIMMMFEQGPGKIRELMAEAEKLGLAFSTEDIAKMEKARDAMKQLGGAWTGLKQEMAIAAAPFLSEWTIGLGLLIGDFRRLTGMDVVSEKSKAAEEAAQKTRQLAAAQEEYNRRLEEAAEIAEKSKVEVDSFIRDLQNDIKFSGFEPDERKLEEMLQAGKFGAENERYMFYLKGKRLVRERLEMERATAELERKQSEQQGLMGQGRSLAESLATPIEQYKTKLADANRLVQVGAISWQVYQRAVAAAADEAIRLQTALRGPQLIEAGSQEAFAAIAEWQSRAAAAAEIQKAAAEVMAQRPQLRKPGPVIEPMVPIDEPQNTPASKRYDFIRNDPNAPEMLKRLDQIKVELVAIKQASTSTEGSSRRTATAVERTERPEVVDM